MKRFIVFNIVALLVVMPPLHVFIHESGHALWAILSGGSVEDFSAGIARGYVSTSNSLLPLMLGGAYSIGMSMAIISIRLYGLRGLFAFGCYISHTIIGVYASLKHSPFGGDFYIGIGPVAYGALLETAFIVGIFELVRRRIRRIKRTKRTNSEVK
jgi:hypothetical protein